jgi:hypothetical protein
MTMFIYKLKVDASGLIKHHKAHLITKGFTQKWGTNYNTTFMPVVLLAITLGLEIHQMDVKSAFLHTPIQEEINIMQPEGYINPEHPNHICQLQKLYRLKQAPYKWNRMLNKALVKSGLEVIEADVCIYIKQANGMISITTIHINNCIILAHKKLLRPTKAALSAKFKMKDLSKARSILGMELLHNTKSKQLYMNFRPSNQDNHKSLSTIEASMCRGIMAWSVKTQPCVALSTTKAKLYAISTGVCQALYMHKLFPPLSLPVDLPVQIYNNNQSFHRAKKHYNIHMKHAHEACP